MSDEEWGPWIIHDGLGCLCVGKIVQAYTASSIKCTSIPDGSCQTPEPGKASLWLWKSVPILYSNLRITKYRVRNEFSAMALLKNIIQDVEPGQDVDID